MGLQNQSTTHHVFNKEFQLIGTTRSLPVFHFVATQGHEALLTFAVHRYGLYPVGAFLTQTNYRRSVVSTLWRKNDQLFCVDYQRSIHSVLCGMKITPKHSFEMSESI